MSSQEGGTFLVSGMIGGLLTFLEANWIAVIIVPILTGFLGVLGKELAKTLILNLKERFTNEKKK